MQKEFSFKTTKKVPTMKQLQTIADSTPIHPAYIMDQVGQYRNVWHESILYLAVWGTWVPTSYANVPLAGYRELNIDFAEIKENQKGDVAFLMLKELIRVGLPIYDDSEVLALTFCQPIEIGELRGWAFA